MKNKRIFYLLIVMGTFGLCNINAQNMKSNRALLIIDIQNDYFEGGANPLVGTQEASLNARKLLDYFRKDSLLVIHIQHVSFRNGSVFFLPNTKGVMIHENVLPLIHEKVIIKSYPNSFHDTELLRYLKTNDVTDLVICGMMTHMCVDATVRAAKDFGFNCTIISDACATKNINFKEYSVSSKNVQSAFLAALSYYYSTVQFTDEYLNSYKK